MIRVFLTIIHDVKHNKTLIKIVLIASVLHKKKKEKIARQHQRDIFTEGGHTYIWHT